MSKTKKKNEKEDELGFLRYLDMYASYINLLFHFPFPL